MRQKRSKNYTNTDSKLQQDSLLPLVVLVVAIAVIVGSVFIYWLVDVLTSDQLMLVIGIVATLVIIIVATACFSMFVLAYSRLRSKEQAEDDKRELELLRALNGMRSNQTIKVQAPQLPYGEQRAALPQWKEVEQVVFD